MSSGSRLFHSTVHITVIPVLKFFSSGVSTQNSNIFFSSLLDKSQIFQQHQIKWEKNPTETKALNLDYTLCRAHLE